ncbi:hypothetical protein RchiOBHm_Chr6g0309981 [Rosa chinensis]|uniref:DUF4378 domain-containing protein n=1 Tax=Rosa chinensis TaxID=74649 RepID=A0A2P6Q125_ROSCH|nr:uncharacterized protein LOC112170034 isoform X1 [Rosa chinensis]PRQ27875.1 hypothetical protein RchiOBHm_Chr6g0309981 [Rosa chinensis]
MASTTTKPVKQLGELLQEQQEPFVLDVYLFERGCLRKSLSSSNSINSSKSLKRSSSCGPIKSKKGTPSFSKILRSVYNKLVSKNGGSRTKSSGEEEGKFDANTEITLPSDCLGDLDEFSSSSSRTRYESCCDSDKDEACATVLLQNEDEASLAVEGTSQVPNLCNMKEETKIALLNGESSKKKKKKTQTKQHTSISVLEDRPSHAVPNSVLSASLWELLFQPPLERPRDTFGVPEMLEPVIRSNSSPHKSKRMLQQTRQLLFDCVREVTESHAKQMKEEQNSAKFLGAEELGKLISEKLRIWDRQAGDETNIDFLLDSDILSSAEEWNCNEQEEREICCEIGDAILEEIIKETVALPISLDPVSF